MTVRDAAGTIQSKNAILASMVEVTPDENRTYRFAGATELYEHLTLPGHIIVDGDRRVAFTPGQVYTRANIDSLFPRAIVDAVTPDSGLAAGGTVVVLTGHHLTGVTNVAFGGINGAALQPVTEHEVRVTTPANAVGRYDIVVTDDAGNVTVPGAFTYA